MWGGFQGEGSKTVIPAEAHAKISCRLVPNQDPEKIAALVAQHLRSACPPSARIDVTFGHGGNPWACDPQTPVLQAAVRALQQTFQQPVALARLGGSIPVVETFAAILKAPVILMGFAPPDANAHAPNESMDLPTWELSRLAICRAWQEIAQSKG
jgi:acetylornithine deacetylase/succinyl-diaminopimelate desuccinylase-like protein